jgi:hypothetical protein
MQQQEPFEVEGDYPDSLFLFERALSPDDCRLIIERFERRPHTEMTQGLGQHGEGAVAVNEEENYRMKYVDQFGKVIYNIIHPDNEDFDYIMEKVNPFLPKNDEFGTINFASILKYPVNALMPPHKDVADLNDTAAALILLNEDYEGGRLSVDGHIIYPRTGSVIAFNNPTERWHSVEPIYEGARYCLALWFGFTEEYMEVNEQEQEQEEKREGFKTVHLPKNRQESDATD